MKIKEVFKNKKYQKIAKWTGWGILTLILIVIVLIVSLYFVLRSGTLTQTALSKINPITNTFGVNISKLDSAQIDLLKAVSIRGLALSWQDDVLGKANLTAKEIRLNYSLSELLDSKLTISEIFLDDIDVKANLNILPSEKKTEEESKPLDLTEIEDLLTNPPMPIQLKSFTLNDVRLSLNLNQGETTQQLTGHLDRLGTRLAWDSNKLALNTDLQINQDSHDQWSFTQTAPNATTQVEFTPKVTTRITVDLSNTQTAWQLNDFKLLQQINLENIAVTNLVKDTEPSNVTAKLVNLDLTTTKRKSNTTSSAKSLMNLFPLEVTTIVSSNINTLTINLNDPSGLKLQSNINNNQVFKLESTIKTLEPLAVQNHYSLDENLNIENLDLNDHIQTANMSMFGINLQSTGTVKLDNNIISNLTNDTKLALNSNAINYEKKGNKKSTPSLKAELFPNIRLNAKINAPSIEDLNSLSAKIDTDIKLNNVFAQISENKKEETYRIKQNYLRAKIDLNNQLANVIVNLNLDKLSIPQLEKTVNLEKEIKLNSDIALKAGQLALNVNLEKKKILASKFKFDNQAKRFDLTHNFNLDLPLWLKDIHEGAQALNQIGHTNISLKGNSQLSHNATDIQSANTNLIDQWPIKTNGKLVLLQKTKPTSKEGLHIKDNLVVDYDIDKSKVIRSNLTVSTPGLQADPILAPIPLTVHNKSELTWPLSKTLTSGYIKIGKENALAFDLDITDEPEILTLLGEITVSENPQWQRYLKEFQQAEDIGKLTLNLKPNLKLKHSAKTITQLSVDNPEELNVDLSFDLGINQDPGLPGKLITLAKPIILNEKFTWNKGELHSTTTFSIGDLTVKDVARVQELPGLIRLNTSGGLEPTAVNLFTKLDSGNILLYEKEESGLKEMSLSNLATPLKLDLAANKAGQAISLDNFSLDVGRRLLSINSAGNLNLDGTQAQLNAQINSNLNDNQLGALEIESGGKFSLPLELNYTSNSNISLKGKLSFENLLLKSKTFELVEFNGSIPFYEELVTDNTHVAFKYTLATDPFQRVDFSRIQPYLDAGSILQFKNIRSNDLNIGPGMVNVNLNQNLLQVHRMDLDALSGQVLAQVYIDIKPNGQKLGLLSRISNIDPRVLLPESSKEKKGTLSPISTRSAINFTLAERLMEGQIDITKISKDQLLQLLEIVDPEHKDEQIDTVRTALRFAHPENVSVNMVSGLMNLSIDISTLPKPISIRGLPLTPLIQQSAGDIETLLADLPLKDISELNLKEK